MSDLQRGYQLQHPVNGRRSLEIMLALDTEADSAYTRCAEADPAGDAPRSELHRFEDWADSTIYPSTRRNIAVSVPAGGTAVEDIGLIVFQDGANYLSADGPVNASAVLDSLMHSGALAPTVGVFVDPGVVEGETGRAAAMVQRSLEYDAIDDRYARFLEQDVLPFVSGELGLMLSADPARRTACGISSGGICAFNLAWQRPDLLGRVISHCGSFTALRGGHEFPFMVRATERKPIRVWMQSGTGDADIPQGNWFLANQTMHAALEYAGYDVRFESGVGGHNLRHGGALFAETLQWLESEPGGRTGEDDAAIAAEFRSKLGQT